MTELDDDQARIMSFFPERATDGTLHHAVLIAVSEIEQLRAELDRLRKVLLAEWEKDRKTYAALMEKLK